MVSSLSVFFFKQKTAYEVGTGDWSSDVCSSDLGLTLQTLPAEALPTDWQQLKTLSTLCEREYQLSSMVVLLNCEELENEGAERDRKSVV